VKKFENWSTFAEVIGNKYQFVLYETRCRSLGFCILYEEVPQTWFPRLLESPGFFFLKIPGSGKSWKITLVLESPGNYSLRSWKVLEKILESHAFF